MPEISRCCYCLKRISEFHGMIHGDIFYYQKVFMGFIHFAAIASQLAYLLMT